MKNQIAIVVGWLATAKHFILVSFSRKYRDRHDAAIREVTGRQRYFDMYHREFVDGFEEARQKKASS